MKEYKLSQENADSLFSFLTTIEDKEYDNNIKSKGKFTRYGKALTSEEYSIIYPYIESVLNELKNFHVLGGYINKYSDGNMWTPNHSHKGTWQLVISVGATRDFLLSKKIRKVKHGDCILFGSSVHGIPKDETCTEERFSIAFFCIPL